MLFGSEYSTYVKKKYILDAVNTLFTRQRKSKYTNEYLINNILECCLNYQSWSNYGHTLNNYTNLPKFHHKYLNEIYLCWSSLGVFELAYKNLLNDNLDYDNKNLNLNTDVTCISNMYGKENIGVNPEYPKKHVTKLALLNTFNNTPISVFPISNNKILKTHNTLHNDKSSIQPLLNNILINVNTNGNININADKAYISKDQYIYKNKSIKVITPSREKTSKQAKKEIKVLLKNIEIDELKLYKYKNKYGMKSKNLVKYENKIIEKKEKIIKLNSYIHEYDNKIQNKKKSNRYLIENYFCSIKHIPKIYLRTDKLIKTFISTVYIGLLYNYKIIN